MKDKKLSGNARVQQAAAPANSARNGVPWKSLEQQVVRMQMQISQACQRGDKQAVHSLQQRLMESEAARLLAVRRAAEENSGRHTPGVDGVKSLSAEERLAMAATIHPRNWRQQVPRPVRRVWIPKPGTTEQRPVAILPMIDRCKQALVKLALEPEWEAQFEPHSFGFRPGRSGHDAIAAILVAIERQPTYVFDADIEGAFDHVNQAMVLDKLQTYPALRETIQAWLKAGVIDDHTYYAVETGIAQGGVLSPLLMNVALHGMEAIAAGSTARDQAKERPLLIRYADDFVILHTDLKELQQAAKRVRQWLATMGLHLHPGKTRIAHTLMPYSGQVGFDFLGFHIHQESREQPSPGRSGQGRAPAQASMSGFTSLMQRLTSPLRPTGLKTIVAPGQEASNRHLAAIEQKLRQLQQAPQAQVIEELNPMIMGWANYYNGIVPAATLNRYDDLLEQRLLDWAGRRHPGKGRDWLLNRYWQRAGNNRRVFATTNGIQLRAYRQKSILKG
ncbi:MAG TPA: reverse transcriptase domain-containing protein [Ktedonobacteraceae bacterium]|jgi:RNA-directed DNA polymerase|nr:reverse transcriptase domain-containing protein [Ktedonobacteraceae bacterium]